MEQSWKNLRGGDRLRRGGREPGATRTSLAGESLGPGSDETRLLPFFLLSVTLQEESAVLNFVVGLD